MERDFVSLIFFAWIATSALIRFIGVAYVVKAFKVHDGVTTLVYSALLTMFSMLFYMLSVSGVDFFVLAGYTISIIAMLLIPYGLMKFGEIQHHKQIIFAAIATILLSFSIPPFLPIGIERAMAFTAHLVLIPILLFSLSLVHHKEAVHAGVSKKMLTTALGFAVCFTVLRVVLTLVLLRGNSFIEQWRLEEWGSVMLDNAFTMIYFGYLLVNFKMTELSLDKSEKVVEVLSGLLPICAHCKKIRDDRGYWNQIEAYIATHSEAEFTHSLCPSCVKELYGDHDLEELDDMLKEAELEKSGD